MHLYAISDLHLASSINKPMDIFGDRWAGYMDKIRENWLMTISGTDYVLIPGDISWATYIDQAVEDFRYIDSLPGKKIISKGNHDYWWTTTYKMEKFLKENSFHTINFMHNNSFRVNETIICGTRGWKCPDDSDFRLEDDKIYRRELLRLEISLKSASVSECDDIVVAMHYPPFNTRKEPTEFIEIMARYNVKTCVYGHLHGESMNNAFTGVKDGIRFLLVSADYMNFKPQMLI